MLFKKKHTKYGIIFNKKFSYNFSKLQTSNIGLIKLLKRRHICYAFNKN